MIFVTLNWDGRLRYWREEPEPITDVWVIGRWGIARLRAIYVWAWLPNVD